jgi:hypothetical protein
MYKYFYLYSKETKEQLNLKNILRKLQQKKNETLQCKTNNTIFEEF